MIDLMLFDKKSEHFLAIFFEKLSLEPTQLVEKLLQFYQYVPMSLTTTIAIKKFIEFFDKMY